MTGPLPLLLLRRGPVSVRQLGALQGDDRLELIVLDELAPNSAGLAQRVTCVLIATAGDPLAALVYAVTAGVTVPIVVVTRPQFRGDFDLLVSVGAAACFTMPVGRPDVDRLVGILQRRGATTHVDSTLRLLLDPIGRVARLQGESVSLSAREFAVLHCLSNRSGHPVAADELLNCVWGERSDTGQPRQILEVYIFQLRKKLDRLGLKGAIKTVRGFGYTLSHAAPERS